MRSQQVEHEAASRWVVHGALGCTQTLLKFAGNASTATAATAGRSAPGGRGPSCGSAAPAAGSCFPWGSPLHGEERNKFATASGALHVEAFLLGVTVVHVLGCMHSFSG